MPGAAHVKQAETAGQPERPLMIVGIGASAGGLDAFKSFFANMPADSGMAFVLVQHLSPQHDSMLTELVGRSTAMPVVDAADGEHVQANHVYVIPPDSTLTIDGGSLHVSKPAPPREYRWPINAFFTSLAEDQGDCAVCIVLSGLGSDGARGLRAVKEHGGLTLAQSGFNHAAMSGMPASAAATGLVDDILPVEQMPARLVAHQKNLQVSNGHKGPDGERQDLAAHLRTICGLLRAEVGHDFSQYKEKTLARRVQRRMHVVQAETVPDYIAHLRQNPAEHQQLFREVLIGVTEFFRDPEAFETLQTLAIPNLLAGKSAADTLRVWIPGCATGEEAYSIAIALKEAMGTRRGEPKVQIFATDIDEFAIITARAGRYKSPLTGISPERQARWFTQDGDDWCVTKAIREMCVFSPHSAIKDPPFSRMDLVSCRNLLIYLNPELQERVMQTFHYSLRPEGYLLLGPSEGLGRNSKLFSVVSKSHRLYQRSKDSGPGAPARPAGLGLPAAAAPARRAVTSSAAPTEDAIDLGARQALETYSPAYVVIDGNHDIVRFAGDTGRYLGPSSGAASLNLFLLLHRGLRVAARVAVKQALAAGEPVLQEGLTVDLGGTRQNLRLIAAPLPQSTPAKPLCVLAFDELGAVAAADRSATEQGDLVHGLERELLDTRLELQTALEQQATVNEEMKSSNEEYQSVNEELQSANEELETSKEEMQSINEELQTVNAEMLSKNETLAHVNSDLQNLLDSTQIATLFLDTQSRVGTFTPAMTEVFHLRTSDRYRVIHEIAARIDYPDLQHDVAKVLRTLEVIERELDASDSERVFLLRMRPYRTVDNVIDGVVLTFVDISERRQQEVECGQLAAIVQSSREIIIGHTLEGTITSWNASAERVLGYPGSRMLKQSIALLMPGQDKHADNALLLACGLDRGKHEIEMDWRHQDGSLVPVGVTCSPVLDPKGKVIAGSLIARDIGERQLVEQNLQASQRHLHQLIEQTTAGVAQIDAEGRFVLVNPAFCTIAGRSADALLTLRMQDVIHPDDVLTSELAIRTLLQGGPASQLEKRYLRPDGSLVWVINTISRIERDGELTPHVLAVVQDSTERRRAAEHQELLLGELNHRVKNTLASVQSIALQTVNNSSSLDEFRDAFVARLLALSSTHNLLAVDAWSGVGLREIVHSELAPYQGEGQERAVLNGEALQLTPKAALALSMAFHELATNAVKYGALSVPTGRVDVHWKTRKVNAQPWLRLLWTESDGPVVAPPTRRGFGTRLISDGLAFELDGTVALEFKPGGLVCRIDVPLSEIEAVP